MSIEIDKEGIRKMWYWLTKNILTVLPNVIFINFIFLINCVRLKRPFYLLSIRKPKTFNEKINWLKFYTRYPNGKRLADKLDVRSFVSDRIGSTYLVPLLGIYNDVNEIDFKELPDKFVLKTTHGSGWNVICMNKLNLNLDKVKQKLSEWLKRNPYYLCREWQYNVAYPRIICEELIGENVNDYKFFCFNGKVKYIQVDIDRFTQHKRNLYDTSWNLINIEINYPRYFDTIARPTKLTEMITLAEKLSSNILFVRVDLYFHGDQVYFGEMTLFPGSGFEPFNSYASDLEFGRVLILNGEHD